MAWAVGVDLGGTNVRAAQVDEAGTVGSVLFEPLDPGRSTRPFAQLIDMTASLIEKAAGDPPVGDAAAAITAQNRVGGAVQFTTAGTTQRDVVTDDRLDRHPLTHQRDVLIANSPGHTYLPSN